MISDFTFFFLKSLNLVGLMHTIRLEEKVNGPLQ